MTLRHHIAKLLLAAGNALDSPYGRACREAHERELLRRALEREAHREFGNTCARIAKESK